MTTETTSAPTAPYWLRGQVTRWVFATDHRRIGALWLVVAGLGFALGGILSLVAALHTGRPGAAVLGEGTYASIATAQGTLLAYVGILPLVLGLGVAIVPLQLGARGIARPGVATAGFWFGASGSLAVVFSSFAPGDAPRSSWTTFPPAALAAERPGETLRLMGLLLIALGVLLTAVALVATFRGTRAPGLTDDRLPLFAQSVRAFAVASLILAPLSLLGSLLLLLARGNGDTFAWYITDDGGLLRGYGWVFNQGLVAVALAVALGASAEIIATFTRGDLAVRRLVGLGLAAGTVLIMVTPSADIVAQERWAAVLALVATAALAAVAATLLPGALRAARSAGAATPLPFALGSLVLLLAAFVASVVLVVRDQSLPGTTFATARLDLLWASAFVALAGGLVYWWPKLRGRMLDARTTSLSAVVLTGSALVLAVGRGVAGRNPASLDGIRGPALVAAVGMVGLVLGGALLIVAVVGARTARRVGNDPWQGDTLEWYTTSPPPERNFDSLPPVASARPLADLRRALREPGAR